MADEMTELSSMLRLLLFLLDYGFSKISLKENIISLLFLRGMQVFDGSKLWPPYGLKACAAENIFCTERAAPVFRGSNCLPWMSKGEFALLISIFILPKFGLFR